ncbi:molecular chaperone TorD family protein [Halomonas mongoliensis]|jgi:TorA maturation chaperone TorD|uniref:Molecular chaperone TorD family protein n=1 Tax=Halomonas mongoliensis TaxID=321265 RepID=A0ABU1GKK8_9GAMM|nr:molecular chaperone TorD family protein [Halomonas mongoliensis]MDR5892541.1 molecular chaperone TorD family protein [Halomonas mongoliensis]
MDDLIATTPSVSEHDALRADIYRLLARLLLAPPDAALLDFLAGLEADDEDPEMAAIWRALAAASAATTPGRAERDHFELLVGVIQGEVTPYASWYLHGTLMDEPLVALRRDLRRLGLARSEESRDPEDHLGALCEAMALLAERGDPEQARFFAAHLAPWANRCLAELAASQAALYAETGRLGLGFMAREHHYLT